MQSVRNLLGLFGMNMWKAAMPHALDAGTAEMMPRYEGIRGDMEYSRCGKGDETPIPRNGMTGHAWDITTDREMLVVIWPSRNTAVLALH